MDSCSQKGLTRARPLLYRPIKQHQGAVYSCRMVQQTFQAITVQTMIKPLKAASPVISQACGFYVENCALTLTG